MIHDLDWNDELAFVRELALEAGKTMLDAREAPGGPQFNNKGPVDLVTEVDLLLEERIVSALQRRHPGHAVIAEEGHGEADRDGAAVWFVDPLDGTTNFVHGYPFFAVSIACWVDRQPRLGVVHAPALDELYAATHGNGATLERPMAGVQPRSLQVSGRSELGQALLSTGYPYARGAAARLSLRCSGEALLRSRGLRRGGSAALDLCYVAAGRLDGYWELTLRPWDVAAGSLIAIEAGAVVSDFVGKSSYLDSGRICAATPDIHPQMLEMLASAHRQPERWPLGEAFAGPVDLTDGEVGR